MRERDNPAAFEVQGAVRGPWRAYLDALSPLRPELHRYCVRLTGSLWDGEDLAQDALIKVFSMLGKVDADLKQPRGYLLRTATTLWIDRCRRADRERAWRAGQANQVAGEAVAADDPASAVAQSEAVRAAAGELLARLPPRERAAVMMKDVFDLSLEDTAAVLRTSVGAVKAALHRGRGRLGDPERDAPRAASDVPPELIERFVEAMEHKDIEALRALCLEDVCIELVGGNEMHGFEDGRPFFEYAHMTFPALGLGDNPHWRSAVYQGELVVLGFRTLNGEEVLNEANRFEVFEGKIARLRCYCFCPDTMRMLGAHLGLSVGRRPYRSLSRQEVMALLERRKPQAPSGEQAPGSGSGAAPHRTRRA